MGEDIQNRKITQEPTLRYLLLGVRKDIQSGAFFALSPAAQAVLMALTVDSGRSGSFVFHKDRVRKFAGVRDTNLYPALNELVAGGYISTERASRRAPTLVTLPLKSNISPEYTDGFVYIEPALVASGAWASFAPSAKSLFWYLRGCSGTRDMFWHTYPHLEKMAEKMGVFSGFTFLPLDYFDEFLNTGRKCWEILGMSKPVYYRWLTLFKNEKYVYTVDDKSLKGYIIKNIHV